MKEEDNFRKLRERKKKNSADYRKRNPEKVKES